MKWGAPAVDNDTSIKGHRLGCGHALSIHDDANV